MEVTKDADSAGVILLQIGLVYYISGLTYRYVRDGRNNHQATTIRWIYVQVAMVNYWFQSQAAILNALVRLNRVIRVSPHRKEAILWSSMQFYHVPERYKSVLRPLRCGLCQDQRSCIGKQSNPE